MAIRVKRALVGLATAAAVLILPAVASAAVTPGLTVTPSTTVAGTNPATVGFDATFSSAPNDVSFALPAGLLANADQAGGACLIASSPTAACQVGSGTVTAGGMAGLPVSLYLVGAPKAGDAAGLALVQGSTTLSVADVTVRSADGGLNIAFSNLSADALTELNVSFTTLRLPTSCPSPAANVTLTADGTPTTAPLNVTGCSSLGYAPSLSATITKDSKDTGGELALGITQAATEAANKTITFGLPVKVISPNAAADLPCLSTAGCTIGTAAATSPLVPSIALANGTVTLGGSATTPTIAVTFPAPFSLTIAGTVDLATNSVTFNSVPDVPLTSLNLTITGPNGQKAFTINSCSPNNVTGSFTGQGGQSATSNAGIKFINCAANPTATGSFSGLAAGNPKLRFKATHGKGGPNIGSVAVGLPTGLKFSHSAFVTKKTCVTKSGKKECTTVTQIKGLGVSGASVKSVALKGGKLVITVKKAAGSVSVNLSGPVLTESSSLQTKVKKHKVKTLTVNLKIGTTTVPLKLTAH
ncbi:MAG TPA: hypothetical protein VMA96_09840 [Solirubrobacteraceae bacterium]|nr:hypothetical protein [Solirubrobacteraceae bacterium]